MTTVEDSKYPKNGIMNKTTFYENDSFVVEMYWNDKLQEHYSGKYKLDEGKKLLITKIDTSEFHSEVVELTNKSLVTKLVGTNTVNKFKRL
jgi:hypothetical protein